MVKVGLIGFGLAGQAFHAPVIQGVEGMELACILERRGSLAQQNYPGVRVARNLDELLADKSVQLCVVATPNDSHFSLAQACLLAGRDVVVDKPFAPTWKECQELAQLAAACGRLLTVYQNRRWDGDFRTLTKLVRAGTLGDIVEYESRFDRFRLEAKPVWREREDHPGSGVLFDLGPHLIDQALVLFGEPQSITAKAFRQREGSQVDDAFDVCLEYPRLRAMLRARIIAFAPGPHFLLHGTKGSFLKYAMDPQEERLRSGKIPPGKDWGKDWGAETEQEWGTLSLAGEPRSVTKIKSEPGDYRGFYANVRDAIEKGTPLDVTMEQALRTMRALLLARKSSREERTVRWEEEPE
jgi:scyllo-inositol 2-dehydrogenase (NADP+)